MTRISIAALGSLLASALALAGCGAQQAPFKFHSDEDLAHYNQVATEIEYPNIADCPTDAAITCLFSTKSEILVDHAVPRAGAEYQPAHGSHGHHAPLDRASGIEPVTMTIALT